MRAPARQVLLLSLLSLCSPLVPACSDAPSRASCEQAIDKLGEVLFAVEPARREPFVARTLARVDRCTSSGARDRVECVGRARTRAGVLECLGDPAQD